MQQIDSQMQQIYQQGASKPGGQVSQEETMQLIQRAEELNSSKTSSFSSSTKNRGNASLQSLVMDNKSHFPVDSQQMIHQYLQTGKVPNSQAFSHGAGRSRSSHSEGGASASARSSD